MGRVQRRWTRLFALTAAIVLIAQSTSAYGQTGSVPSIGSASSVTSQPVTNGNVIGQPDPATTGPVFESAVSFITSAVPTSQVKLLFDCNYGDRQPTRNEYLFSKSGIPGSPGWLYPERSVDWQQLASVIEVAYQNMFSAWIELPTRFVNPEVNPDAWGMADLQLGLKYAFISTGGLSISAELQGTIPTRMGPGLSTDHFSVEPGLLFYLRPMDFLTIEGEFSYWFPIAATDFAGDMLHYGVGFSIGQQSDSLWFTPVLELEGWTMLGGKEGVVMPDGYYIKSTSGETIVNAILGLRAGFGPGDMYVGYGHSMTGDAWQHEFWRIEFRVRY